MSEETFSYADITGPSPTPSSKGGPNISFKYDELYKEAYGTPANHTRNIELIQKELANPSLSQKGREVLLEELKKEQDLNQGKSESSPETFSYAEIAGKEGTETFSYADIASKGESPGYISSIGQGLASSAGEVARLSMGLGGSLVNTVTQSDIADPMIAKGNEWREKMGTAVLSKEEQANQGLPQKVAGAVAGAIPLFAAGPVPAAVAMTGMGSFNQGADLLDQGADLGEAEKASAAGTVLTGASLALPGLGKTMPHSIALGSGGNLASEVATKSIIQEIMVDKPEIAERYKIKGEDLVIAAATGGVMGVGMHKVNAHQTARAAKKEAEYIAKVKEFTDSWMGPLQDQITDITGGARTRSGKTLEQVIKDPSSNVYDTLDAIISNEKSRLDQKELAKALLRLDEVTGHGRIPVYQLDKEGHTVPGGNYMDGAGVFDWGKNGATHRFDEETITHRNLDPNDVTYSSHVLLHEIVHSVSSKAINWYYEDIISKGVDPRSLGSKQKRLYDKIDTLNDLFKNISDRVFKSTGEYPRDNLIKIQKTDPSTFREKYGFSNLKEFVSETLTNKDFQKYLRDIKLTKEEVTNYKTSSRGIIANAWDAFKAAFKRLFSDGEPHSMLDVALDKSIDLIENSQSRHQAQRDYQIQEGKDALNANAMSKFVMRRISDLLDKSGSNKDMFETRMYAESMTPQWQEFVKQNLDQIWDNAWRIREVVGENKDYATLSETDQLFQQNPLNVDEFINQSITYTRELVGADDLKASGTNVYSGAVLNLLKSGSIAGKIIKFYTDKSKEYRTLQAVLFHRAMEQFSDFNKMGIKDKKQLMDAAIRIDTVGYRQKLADVGMQWPDETMLRQDFPKLTDEHIKAYQNITKGLDFLHNLLNQARVVKGEEPLKQIPGYMPHVHDGTYKVFMTHTNADGKSYVVTVRGFKTKYGALAEVKKIESGSYGPDFGIDVDKDSRLPYRVQKHGDLTSGMTTILQEHLNAYYNQLELAPEAQAILKKIETDSMTGFTKHDLERSDIDGYIGFNYTKKGGITALKEKLGILSGENKKILSLYENYARSVTDYYKNVLFVNEVASRILGSGSDGDKQNYGLMFAKLPKLNKYLSEFTYNFTGENINKLGWVDDFFRDTSLKLGIDPNLYRRIAREARNDLSLIKLRVNPANYLANFIQPVHMMSMLQFVNGTRSMGGLKNPNVLVTFAKVLKDRLNPDAYQRAGLEWAREQHHLDPQLEPEMRAQNPSPFASGVHKATLGDVNPYIEGIGRTTSFLMALEHFRAIYPDDPMAARTAAANMTEMVMVNYDRSSRPLMYQNMGVMGEAISPFAVFRNAYVGNTHLMIKLAAKNPATMKAWAPMILMQTTYLLTAGAMGMVGAAEWDLLAKELNEAFPSLGLPTLAEILYKHKIPDHITYGVISAGSKKVPGLEEGANLGGSMNAVGADDIFQAAMLPFVTAIATVAGIGVREALHFAFPEEFDPVGSRTGYKALRQLVPGIAHKYLEDYYKNGADTVGLDTKMHGDTTRTPAGDRSLMITGKKSLVETTEGTINYNLKMKEQRSNTEIKDLVEAAADYAQNLRNIDIAQIRRRAGQLGVSSSDFDQKVVDEIMKRRTTTRYRESEKDTNKARKSQRERAEME